MSARTAATAVLSRVLNQGQSLDHVLPSALQQISKRDRGLLQELCYGTLRWYFQLRYLLDQLLDKPLKRREQEVQTLLLLSFYQLLHLRVPAYAVVSEAVATVRALGKSWAAKLVNGVLRNFQRHQATWMTALARDEIARYAHPVWLLCYLQQDWPDDWRSIVEVNNSHPPQSLRVNLARLSRQRYLEILTDAGIEAIPSPVCSAGITLAKPCDIEDLPGFREGWVSVQDLAAQLAVGLLDLQPNMRVLDACAAPGGKTCHILEHKPLSVSLLALDLNTQRLNRLRENLKRLGLKADTLAVDAMAPSSWWDGRPYDRILLDVPCSASGVIRRHPDIKVLRQEADIEQLTLRQHAMLHRLWPLLAPKGKLVYATCSILKQENENIVADFLATQPDAQEMPIAAAWGRAELHGRQILPGELDMDGFYYACLVKND